MTYFGYPWMLLLLALVVILVIYYRKAAARDRRLREDFAEEGRFGVLGIGRPTGRKVIGAALVVASTILTVLALARPLSPEAVGERTVSMDVIIALDVSDSMGVADVKENRLAAAKDFIGKLVSAAPDNRYGLALFSGDAVVTCPPTMDHDAFLGILDDADFGRANVPGTAIGEGILSAMTRFKKGDVPRAVLVVSDGENTYGADPAEAAANAKGSGLRVFTVGVGTKAGGTIVGGYDFFGRATLKRDRQGRVVNSALDEAALIKIADAGGGRYFAASDLGAVRALAGELSVKSQKVIKDPFAGRKEYGPYFALAAFFILAAALMI